MAHPWGPHISRQQPPPRSKKKYEFKKYDFLQNYMVLAKQLDIGHKLHNSL